MDLNLGGLVGTLRSYFKIGGTLRLKNASGSLSVRNGGDSADAGIVAASIKITTSPSNGYVLTSDASGNGTWAASSGGTPVLAKRYSWFLN